MQSRGHLMRLPSCVPTVWRKARLARRYCCCLVLMGRQLKLNLQIIIMRENEIHIRKGEGGREGWRRSRKGDGEEDSGATEAEGIKGGGGVKEMGKVEGNERDSSTSLWFAWVLLLGATQRGEGEDKREAPVAESGEEQRNLYFFVPISHLFLLGFLPVLAALCRALRWLLFSHVGLRRHGYGSIYKHKAKCWIGNVLMALSLETREVVHRYTTYISFFFFTFAYCLQP